MLLRESMSLQRVGFPLRGVGVGVGRVVGTLPPSDSSLSLSLRQAPDGTLSAQQSWNLSHQRRTSVAVCLSSRLSLQLITAIKEGGGTPAPSQHPNTQRPEPMSLVASTGSTEPSDKSAPS